MQIMKVSWWCYAQVMDIWGAGVKQSPPVPTHSADLRGRHRIRKGSWGVGTELHVYEMFGRVEAVRRDSGLTV